jgi:hypothetical protein
MIDGLYRMQLSKGGEEQTLESIAVAGASAIQRLISERDDLRVRVNMQQGDLVHLTTTNSELRRWVISIRQHYIELATTVLAQLEQFDHATRELIEERQCRSFDGRDEDANLVSLGHRLKPAGARQTSIADLDQHPPST